MRAFITGGAGFIGSHLTDYLIRNGAEVHVLDNLVSGLERNVNREAKLHIGDIRADESAELLLRCAPDCVFHLAAQIGVGPSLLSPSADADTNVVGTLRLLEACRSAGAGKLVFSSSSAVYGDLPHERISEESPPAPLSFYGLSKDTAERYIRLYSRLTGLNYTILRYGNVYGPRQRAVGEGGVVAIFLDRLQRDLPLVVHGDGEQTRDFVYVRDVVRANAAAVRLGDKQIINIGTGRKTSIRQLAALLSAVHGSPAAIERTESRSGDIRNSCLNPAKAARLLGWEAEFALARGLAETHRALLN
ncbi:NAD-dependent epimerase/dehydratase family protein [Cohnella fermenti]|uniref:NAD-dependent epimerase/dehydratase family protein n=1 Tax=Cohnella fermenti TaxID=2565925 RepID=A0A4S4BWG0_9BACL|nr:NAD-dependent epimerase/dehydratase family protein [Cohnella fermenti]THF79524.1 NAD-dependent epimerase/dehydratase family protein [Cohnella fermenti]